MVHANQLYKVNNFFINQCTATPRRVRDTKDGKKKTLKKYKLKKNGSYKLISHTRYIKHFMKLGQLKRLPGEYRTKNAARHFL